MLEMKGTIVKEKERYSGFTKWIKLIIGSHGIKQGDVMIEPEFPGLERFEKKLNENSLKQRDRLKEEALLPLMRQLVESKRSEQKDNAKIRAIEREIEKVKKQITHLEHIAHHNLVGKRFRLIIYDD